MTLERRSLPGIACWAGRLDALLGRDRSDEANQPVLSTYRDSDEHGPFSSPVLACPHRDREVVSYAGGVRVELCGECSRMPWEQIDAALAGALQTDDDPRLKPLIWRGADARAGERREEPREPFRALNAPPPNGRPGESGRPSLSPPPMEPAS